MELLPPAGALQRTANHARTATKKRDQAKAQRDQAQKELDGFKCAYDEAEARAKRGRDEAKASWQFSSLTAEQVAERYNNLLTDMLPKGLWWAAVSYSVTYSGGSTFVPFVKQTYAFSVI